MNLSVVIVSWNVGELLVGCLDSLSAEPLIPKLEVVVVDNASSDSTVQMLSERFPWVQVIASQHNVGFAAANNIGIHRSNGDYVLLLNPDTEVKPGALSFLLEFLSSNPNVGAVGPRIINPDGSLQHSCSPAPTFQSEFKRLFHLPGARPDGYYEMQNWDTKIPHPTDILLGACIMMPRAALTQVGLFDEDYFMYSEETDLCYRLKCAGWEIYWVPDAQIVHYGGQSTKQAAREMFLRLYQSKTLFFRKNYGTLAALTYKLLLAFVALSRLFLSLLVWFQPAVQRQRSLAQAGNYLRLLSSLPSM